MESHSDYSHPLTLVRGYRPRLTADKRLQCYAPSPKFASQTSFIRKPFSKMRGAFCITPAPTGRYLKFQAIFFIQLIKFGEI